MQLNLFEWDNIEVGLGYQSLARLDFAQARVHFFRALAICPGQVEAGRGLEETEFWEGNFQEADGLVPETALTFLWERIAAYRFVISGNHRHLRHFLLRYLLCIMTRINDGERWYQPPDFCRGYLHLQLGENVEAERYLRILLETLPEKGILHRYLGDAL